MSAPSSTSNSPDRSEVYILNGSFSFNPTKAWNRTQNLLGATAGDPVVSIEPVTDRGHVEGLDIFIDPSNTDNQPLLVHEFAHVIHFQNNPAPDVTWSGQQFAFKTYQEGLARWTERTYAANYMNTKLPSWTLPTTSPIDRYSVAHYVAGIEYARWWLNQSQNSTFVNASYPQTAEAVLHPNRNDNPTPLQVKIGSNTTELVDHGPDRIGEMGLQVTLWTVHDQETAVSASTGWGNDRFVSFETGKKSAGMWVIQWDNVTSAIEGREAFDVYTKQGPRSYGAPQWRPGEDYLPPSSFQNTIWKNDSSHERELKRLDSRTIVVLVGDEALIEQLQICRNGTEVQVSKTKTTTNSSNCGSSASGTKSTGSNTGSDPNPERS